MIKVSYAYQISQDKVTQLISTFSFFNQIFPLYQFKTSEEFSESNKLQILSKIKKGI